jgi:hypothetical protein
MYYLYKLRDWRQMCENSGARFIKYAAALGGFPLGSGVSAGLR